MKDLIIIAAIGKNRELGVNNNLIWHIKEDMKFFKETTTGHPIVMGRKTYFSLPKMLPNRTHIVLTRSEALPSDVLSLPSIEEFMNLAKVIDTDFYVIGGGSIYKEFLPYATKMILTEIEETFREADTFFPEIDENLWDTNVIGEYQDKGLKYLRKVYKRNNK